MSPRTLALSTAVAGLVSAVALPAAAQTYTSSGVVYQGNTAAYEECERKDNDDQIIGAVAGGLLGGFLGNEIEKGEGTVIGGAAGAYAGAKIADKNCDRFNGPEYRQPVYSQNTYGQTTYTQPAYRTDAYGRTVVTTNVPAPQVAGRVETRTTGGMVLVTDAQTGQRFYVSQADYDRYYR